jgi:hypothetical protein
MCRWRLTGDSGTVARSRSVPAAAHHATPGPSSSPNRSASDLQRILPVNGDTVIDLGVLTPGRLDYSCGMGMYTGRLTIV